MQGAIFYHLCSLDLIPWFLLLFLLHDCSDPFLFLPLLPYPYPSLLYLTLLPSFLLKPPLTFFFFSLIGAKLLYSVVLVSAFEQQCESKCDSVIIIYMHKCIPSLSSLPRSPYYLTPLGHHRAPGWAPCTIQKLPTSHLLHTW